MRKKGLCAEFVLGNMTIDVAEGIYHEDVNLMYVGSA